jgi:hypothetical protein
MFLARPLQRAYRPRASQRTSVSYNWVRVRLAHGSSITQPLGE